MASCTLFLELLISLIYCQQECDPPPYQDAFIFPDKSYAVRYYSNMNISQSSDTLTKPTKLIIVIHGAERNANDYYSAMCTAAQMEGYKVTNKDIIIVAPRFMEASDNPASYEYYWSGGWRGGSNSVIPQNNPSQQVSSYTVTDTIITLFFILSKHLYPNLQNVTIVGHSAGGQYTMRYGLTSPLQLDKNKYFMKYVPANPSSFSWLDSRRWFNDETYRDLTPQEESKCPGYNEWIYGWSNKSSFPLYIRNQNLTLEKAKQKYILRNVTYLHGTNDVCNHVDNSSCSDGGLDTSCNALLQGEFRLERGINFLRSLQEIYGTFQHRIDLVPFVGHDHVDMFQHPNGRRAIF